MIVRRTRTLNVDFNILDTTGHIAQCEIRRFADRRGCERGARHDHIIRGVALHVGRKGRAGDALLVEIYADHVVDGFDREERDRETGIALRMHLGRDVVPSR